MTTEQPTAVTTEAEAARPPRAIRTRRVVLRVVYILVSLLTILMSTGVLGLVTGKLPDGPYAYAAAGTTAWKLLSLGGYFVIAWTAGRSVVAVQWVLVGQVTWFVAGFLVTQDPTQGVAVGALGTVANAVLFLAPWVLLAPERRQVLHLRAHCDRISLALATAVLAAGVAWAYHNAHLAVPQIKDVDGYEVRFDLTGLALILGTVGLLAAARPSGRRWLLGVVAAGALYLGVGAVVTDPADLASPGWVGAAGLLAVAATFAWRATVAVDKSAEHSKAVAGSDALTQGT